MCVCVLYLPTVAVYVILYIHTDSTGALIQDGKLGLVVEQPGHLHSQQQHITTAGKQQHITTAGKQQTTLIHYTLSSEIEYATENTTPAHHTTALHSDRKSTRLNSSH